MNRSLLLFATLALLSCSVPDDKAQAETEKAEPQTTKPDNSEWTTPYTPNSDEIMYCGTRFTIAIPKGDRFLRDPNTAEDFDLYHWDRGDSGTTFYVGNFPQDADLYIPVDAEGGWPAIIAVHGSKDDARTLRLTDENPQGCKAPELLKEE